MNLNKQNLKYFIFIIAVISGYIILLAEANAQARIREIRQLDKSEAIDLVRDKRDNRVENRLDQRRLIDDGRERRLQSERIGREHLNNRQILHSNRVRDLAINERYTRNIENRERKITFSRNIDELRQTYQDRQRSDDRVDSTRRDRIDVQRDNDRRIDALNDRRNERRTSEDRISNARQLEVHRYQKVEERRLSDDRRASEEQLSETRREINNRQTSALDRRENDQIKNRETISSRRAEKRDEARRENRRRERHSIDRQRNERQLLERRQQRDIHNQRINARRDIQRQREVNRFVKSDTVILESIEKEKTKQNFSIMALIGLLSCWSMTRSNKLANNDLFASITNNFLV